MGLGMNPPTLKPSSWTALFGAAMLVLVTPSVRADIPDQRSVTLSGIYKVASSTDPIFPLQGDQEWFLDFGNGIASGKLSGSVAVSLRQNPNVKVRLMAWQFFPAETVLVLGNPYAEGSRNAVAKGSWKLATTSSGILWRRGDAEVILQRADVRDY